MAQRRIRVLVVDDHDILRNGLALFFEMCDDLEFVGEADCGTGAIRLCDELRPDVVLMDLSMPEMDGVTAARIILNSHPDIRIIALTSFYDAELVQSALRAGMISYLLKNMNTEQLADAIRAAYEGKAVLAPEAAQVLVNLANSSHEPEYSLTGREREVLALMIKGWTNAEIADYLTVTHFTVKKHVSSILTKLNAATRTEAVALAIQNKLIKA